MRFFAAVPVDGEVEPHQLSELVVAVAQHVGEVVGPVQVGVDGADAAALTVQVTVNLSSNAGQLSNQVHGVLVRKLGDVTIQSVRKRARRFLQNGSCAESWGCKLTSQYLDLCTPSE